MPETRDVLIRVKGEGVEGGATQESVVKGQVQLRDSRVLLRYTERLDDSGAHDPNAETQVRLLAEDGRVMMRRDGAYAVSMVFAPGTPYEGRYHTPFGDLPFTVITEQCSLQKEEYGGRIELRYSLSIQGGEPENRSMRIMWEDMAPC